MTVAKGSEEVSLKISEGSAFPISHMQEGNIIPYISNLDEKLLTTQDVLNTQGERGLDFLAMMDGSNFASGSVYIDDGITINAPQTYVNIEMQAGGDIGGSIKFFKDRLGPTDAYINSIVVADATPIQAITFACGRSLSDPMNTA